MIKIFTQAIKIAAIGILAFILFFTTIGRLEKESRSITKNLNSDTVPVNQYGSLQYSLESRDSINRIIMQNSYSGKFHEIILPKGTIVKSIKIN